MMAQALVVAKFRQPVPACGHKLRLGDDPVAILVKDGEDALEDFVRLALVRGIVRGPLARRLVVQSVNGLELAARQDPVLVQVMELEEGLCEIEQLSML